MHRANLRVEESYDFADIRTNFIYNTLQPSRRQVREHVRKREREIDSAAGAAGAERAQQRAKRGTKLHANKEDSLLNATLLQQSLSRYEHSNVMGMEGLPRVRALKKKGLMHVPSLPSLPFRACVLSLSTALDG